MAFFSRDRLKQTLIGLGIYRPARRIYEKFNRSRSETVEASRAVLSSFLRPGDLCFDVGANVGRKTEPMVKLGARVVAVEPQPRCLAELRALFGTNPNVVVVPKAVGRVPGPAKMHMSSESGLSSLRADWFDHWIGEIDVEVTTLDTLIAEHGLPRYIKMDIEGFELEALHGLTRAVEYLSFEFNIRFIEQAIACVDYLARFGTLRLNLSMMEENRLLAEDGEWWDYEAFLRRFREQVDRNPESWGGDIFLHIEPATT